jgi:predicted nucleic acid-binding protein
VLELVLRTSSAEAIQARLLRSGTLDAPHLIDLEVTQVLRRYVLGGTMTAKRR